MAWRRSSREIWDEFDRMMSDMQRQFSEAVQRLPGTAQQSPVPETVIDVLEHDSAGVVIADLPGVERECISIRLLDPRTLRITARREDVHEEQESAAKLRRQKEQMYEAGKKRLAEQEAENPSR